MHLRRLVAVGIALSCLLGVPRFALADSNVFTEPFPTVTTNASGTVAVTNTFQAVFAAKTISNYPPRYGCTIINYGTHTMYVHADASMASLTNSVQLAAGQIFNCQVGGIVLTDAVSLTGTAGDAFYAAAQ